MNIDTEEVKKELDSLVERGRPFRALISHISGRYHSQESVPKEIIDYALDSPIELSIIMPGKTQEA